MTIDDKIKDENLKYDVNKEATKMSPLLSGKVNKYEFLTGEEILQFIKVEQQKELSLQNLLSRKHLKKKKIEDQRMKLVETLKALKLEEKQKLESIEGLGDNFYTPKINIVEAEIEQINFSEKIQHS